MLNFDKLFLDSDLQQSHVTPESIIKNLQILDRITVLAVTNLVCDNSVAKPSASLHETVFFLQLQRRDGHDETIMQSWCSLLRLSRTSSFW